MLSPLSIVCVCGGVHVWYVCVNLCVVCVCQDNRSVVISQCFLSSFLFYLFTLVISRQDFFV